jgi:hypothetical protein
VGTHPKPAEHELARLLRRNQGMAMKQIAALLGVSVSTVSLWTRDIELTSEQRRRNNFRNPRAPQNPRAIAARARSWAARNRHRRRSFQEEGRSKAREGDALHMAGCMLYWAEGSKRRNSVTLANSDVHLVSHFCRFLTESLGVDAADITISLNVYTNNGLTIKQIERHWLDALGLPRSCLRKHSLNSLPTSSSGQKRNRLPYGVCTIRVHRTQVVQHIYGAIQEYAGFEEPRWLDGPPIKRRSRKARAAS